MIRISMWRYRVGFEKNCWNHGLEYRFPRVKRSRSTRNRNTSTTLVPAAILFLKKKKKKEKNVRISRHAHSRSAFVRSFHDSRANETKEKRLLKSRSQNERFHRFLARPVPVLLPAFARRRDAHPD